MSQLPVANCSSVVLLKGGAGLIDMDDDK
jgi:hypothetical protein